MRGLRVAVVLVSGLAACGGSSTRAAATTSGPDCAEMAAQVVEKIRVDMTHADLSWQPVQAVDSWRNGCLEQRWSAESRLCMVGAVTSPKWPRCLSQDQMRALQSSDPQRSVGDIRIAPDDGTKLEIQSSGRSRIDSSFKVCLDRQGTVISVSLLKSSGFLAYDTKLMNAMRQWAYRPFIILNTPMEVCTAVTIVYSQSP